MSKDNIGMDVPLRLLAKKIPPRNVVREIIEPKLKLVLNGTRRHLLYVRGEGGIGKTHTVLQLLKEYDVPFILLKYPTPLGIFEKGRELTEKYGEGVLVIDGAIYTDPMTRTQIVRILNQMADSKPVRIVQRITKTGQQRKNKDSYEFKGKVVIIGNEEIPFGSISSPVLLTRTMIVDATPKTIEDAIAHIKYVAQQTVPHAHEELVDLYLHTVDTVLKNLSAPRGTDLTATLLNARTLLTMEDDLHTDPEEAIKNVIALITQRVEIFRVIATAKTYQEAKAMLPTLSKRTYHRYRTMLLGGRSRPPLQEIVLNEVKPTMEVYLRKVVGSEGQHPSPPKNKRRW